MVYTGWNTIDYSDCGLLGPKQLSFSVEIAFYSIGEILCPLKVFDEVVHAPDKFQIFDYFLQ